MLADLHASEKKDICLVERFLNFWERTVLIKKICGAGICVCTSTGKNWVLDKER